MSIHGDIASLSLSDVLQNIATSQKAGRLKVRTRTGGFEFIFVEGKTVSCSSDRGLTVDKWLEEKQFVSKSKLDEARRSWRESKKRKPLGECLQELEAISGEDYRRIVTSLVREAAFEALSLTEGTFEFTQGELDHYPSHREAIALGLRLPAQTLVMEAARRADDWQAIHRHIVSEDDVHEVSPPVRESALAGTEDEVLRAVIPLLDGSRTVRQVIARVPYSRFEVSRAIACLVAERIAVPAAGASSTPASGVPEGPLAEMNFLRVTLEKEPDNRDALEKLAALYTDTGQRPQAAVHLKQLAACHSAAGQLADAERWLRRAIELTPQDVAAWQKLIQAIQGQGDLERLEATALEMAAHFKRLGLTEVVREHLAEMVKLVPKSLELKLGFAQARLALGEKEESIEYLSGAAACLLADGRPDDAQRVYQRILEYDPTNAAAKKGVQGISSGLRSRTTMFRRRLARYALAASLLACLTGFFAYDFRARGELLKLTRDVYAEGLIEGRKYDEAIGRIEALRSRFPYAWAALDDAARLLEALKAKARGAK